MWASSMLSGSPFSPALSRACSFPCTPRLRCLSSRARLADCVFTRLPSTLVSQGTTTFTSPLFLAPVCVGAVSLVLLVVNERYAACPLFPMRVFRTRRTIVCLGTTVLNMTSFFLLLTFQYSCSFLRRGLLPPPTADHPWTVQSSKSCTPPGRPSSKASLRALVPPLARATPDTAHTPQLLRAVHAHARASRCLIPCTTARREAHKAAQEGRAV